MEGFGSIADSIENGINRVIEYFEFVGNTVESVLTKITETIEAIQNLPSLIAEKIKTIVDEAVGGILDGLKTLFIPSEGYFSEKITEIKSKFAFAESVMDTARIFVDFFATTKFDKPPKIEMHFSNANSKYDYGNMGFALDLSWYAPYKADVDKVVGSIMWVVFAWNTFIRLNAFIKGAYVETQNSVMGVFNATGGAAGMIDRSRSNVGRIGKKW